MRLPRTKDDILNEMDQTFYPMDYQEHALGLILEVLIDIRDNLEIPYLTEEELDITE